MTDTDLRIVSLIPSATEIVDSLGLSNCLVGISHECDYPPSISDRTVCTAPKFNPEGSSGEVHDRVTELLKSALSVYEVKVEVLRSLQPTHIITQAQCEVCAVSLTEVEQAVTTLTAAAPQIISLQPAVLQDLWQDMRRVGAALLGEASQQAVDQRILALKSRIQRCTDQVRAAGSRRPSVACLEWLDPLMAAGNWMPELVEMAGGRSCFGTLGQHSPWLSWEELQTTDPEVIVLMPCGYDLAKTRAESQSLQAHPNWSQLRAVRTGQVYVTDGNQYFNRPGPRLVDSIEILADILHPDQIEYAYRDTGWQLL